ncbi:MAG: response regulator [Alphaproteobacteria bacterium]|nr:response regulator [Alphaproteobacteria bacterium]
MPDDAVPPDRAALERERRRLRALFTVAPWAIVTVSAEGRVLDANPAAERLLGSTQAELRKSPSRLLDMLSGDDRRWLRGALTNALHGQGVSGELRVRGPTGLTVHEVIVEPVPADERGRSDAALAVFARPSASSLSQRAGHTEAQVRAAQLGLMTRSLTHDLNNALTVLANSLDVLGQSAPPVVRDLATQALGRCRRLVQDLGRIGRVTPGEPVHRVDLGPLLEQVVDELTHNAGALMEVRLTTRPLVSVQGDGAVLLRALRALGLRARRCQAHHLTLTVTPGDDSIRLEVADDGLGMSEAELERLWRPPVGWEKGSAEPDFALLRGHLRAWGGDLQVRSRPDKGTRITLTLPRVQRTHAVARPTPEHALPERILVVEDDAELRRALTWMLRARDVAVFTAANGEEALSVLTDNSAIELVLLDMVLPGAGGLETLEAIRARWPRMPVMMMSGNTDDAQVRACLAAGAAGYLPKPFRMDDLRRALEST